MPRKLVRLISVILCMALLCCATPALAAVQNDYDYAYALWNLGVFQGTDVGLELERTPTRAEGLTMLVRLLGAEEEAAALTGADIPFTDVPEWAHGYVAYAYQQNLTKGISETEFGSNLETTADAYSTFLLRCLGYTDAAGDFSYETAFLSAMAMELFDNALYDEILGGGFTRGNLAHMSYLTLLHNCKDSPDTLLARLVSQGKLDEALAQEFLEEADARGVGRITCYKFAPWVPDFGAMTGARLRASSAEEGEPWACIYDIPSEKEIDNYVNLLLSMGFEPDSQDISERFKSFQSPKRYLMQDYFVVIGRMAENESKFAVAGNKATMSSD